MGNEQNGDGRHIPLNAYTDTDQVLVSRSDAQPVAMDATEFVAEFGGGGGGGGGGVPFARLFGTVNSRAISDNFFSFPSVTQTGSTDEISYVPNASEYLLAPGVYSFQVRCESTQATTGALPSIHIVGGGILTSGNRANTYVLGQIADGMTYIAGNITETVTDGSSGVIVLIEAPGCTTANLRLTITRIGNIS